MDQSNRFFSRVLFFVVYFFLLQACTALADSFTMPDVTGLSKAKAIDKLNEACGNIHVYLRTWPMSNDEQPNGHVFRIKPAPGSPVEAESMIDMYTSQNLQTPENFVKYPNVKGMLRPDAIKTLRDAGFYQIVTEFMSHETAPKNAVLNSVVLSTRYPSGIIKLLVLQEKLVEAPDIRGLTFEQAEEKLKQIPEIKEIKKMYEYYSDAYLSENPSVAANIGKAVKQIPAPESKISPTLNNYFWVYIGERESEKIVKVPRVSYVKEEYAVANLKREGLIPDITYVSTTNTELAGKTSVKTDPREDAEVKVGTKVKFTVYLYKPKIPLLEHVYTKEEAVKMLTDLGLRHEISYISTTLKSNDGKVAVVSPKARTQVEAGSMVKLTIYRYDQVNIPNLVGMTEAKAMAYLKEFKSDLKITRRQENTVYSYKDGLISGTEPAAKTIVRPGAGLTLHVYKLMQSVPNVVGQPESSAVSTLKNAGFIVRKIYQENNNPGKVFQQDPKAGRPATGPIFDIYIGMAPETIPLPRLKGQDPATAAANLKKASPDFEYTIKKRKVFNAAQDGVIIDTFPLGGAQVLPDLLITFYVGERVRFIPNLVGKTESAARSAASQAGFIANINYTHTGPPGQVVNQKPDAGSVPASGYINLFVAQKQNTPFEDRYRDYVEQEYRVPYLVGLSLMEARIRLASVNINFEVQETLAFKDRHGKVISVYPPTGVIIKPNQKVFLTVGKEYYRVPDVVGMKLDRAESVIARDRLQTRIVNMSADLNKNRDKIFVLRQDPAAGTPKKRPYVMLTVAADVEVPYIVSNHFTHAIYTIRNSGLTYDIKYVTVNEGSKDRVVLNASPAPGTKVPFGSMVRLQIGKQPDKIPDLIGKAESEAEAILKNMNFYIQKEYMDSTVPRVVVAQSQNPGAHRGESNFRILLGSPATLSAIGTPTPKALAPAPSASMAPARQLSQGAPAPSASVQALALSADESMRINELYAKLAQAYEYKDEYQLSGLLSGSWASSDGSTVSDVEDNLRSRFNLFDEMQCRVSNLKIQKLSADKFRTSYDIEINGESFETGIARNEKSSVTEEVIREDGRFKINRTISGTFWYVD